MKLMKVGTRIGRDGHTGKLVTIDGVKCVIIRTHKNRNNKVDCVGLMTEFGKIIYINFTYKEDGSYTSVRSNGYFINVYDSVCRACINFQNQLIGDVAYDWEQFLNASVRQQYNEQVEREQLEDRSYRHQCERYGERSYTYGT